MTHKSSPSSKPERSCEGPTHMGPARPQSTWGCFTVTGSGRQGRDPLGADAASTQRRVPVTLGQGDRPGQDPVTGPASPRANRPGPSCYNTSVRCTPP